MQRASRFATPARVFLRALTKQHASSALGFSQRGAARWSLPGFDQNVNDQPLSFLALALQRDVVARAARTAALVGTLLMLINHGDALAVGAIDLERIAKIVLTFAVPYGVATYASVQALRSSQPR